MQERFHDLCQQAEGKLSDSWEVGTAITTLGQPQVIVAAFVMQEGEPKLKGFVMLSSELEWRLFTRGAMEAGKKNGWRLSGSLDALA